MERLIHVVLLAIIVVSGYETARALSQDIQKNVYIILTGVK